MLVLELEQSIETHQRSKSLSNIRDHAKAKPPSLQSILKAFGTFPELEPVKKPPPTQADLIIDKFGGARRLTEYLWSAGVEYSYTTVYKWTYTRAKGGTNGRVPTAAWPGVIAAARIAGILISAEDMDPRAFVMEDLRRNARKKLK